MATVKERGRPPIALEKHRAVWRLLDEMTPAEVATATGVGLTKVYEIRRMKKAKSSATEAWPTIAIPEGTSVEQSTTPSGVGPNGSAKTE